MAKRGEWRKRRTKNSDRVSGVRSESRRAHISEFLDELGEHRLARMITANACDGLDAIAVAERLEERQQRFLGHRERQRTHGEIHAAH